MTKDKFIKFIKDNRHKLVFYNYRGGMGGETICNYLTKETDYFYNETLIYDIFDNKKHIFEHFNLNEHQSQNAIQIGEKQNRTLFHDWMFGNWFMMHSMYDNYNSNNNDMWAGKNTFPENDIHHGWDAFYKKIYDLADSSKERCHGVNCIYGWDLEDGDGKWDYEWKDVDNEMDEILERFAAQDKPYLIRLHGVTPFMKFFEGAKMIDVIANEWERYCTSLSELKVFCSAITTQAEKRQAINEVCANYQSGHQWWIDHTNKVREDGSSPLDDHIHTIEEAEAKKEFLLEYIGDLIYDDTWTLYFKTLDVCLRPESYDLKLENFKGIYELNIFVHALHMFRSFPMLLPYFMRDEFLKWDGAGPWGTQVDEPNHRGQWWKVLYEHERWWYDMINPQLYNMNDMFSGEWIKEQFGLDPKPFAQMFQEWHEGNCRVLDENHIHNYMPRKYTMTSQEAMDNHFNTHKVLP
jgi:hypothetical protein